MPRFLAPWSVWQASHQDDLGGVGHGHRRTDPCDDGCAADPVLTGLREYHRRAAGLVAPYLSELADGQAPHAWFLTCSDSRVVPNVLTSSGPGDLFTVRNVGNLAPPGGSGDDSVGATVEYALDTLRIPPLVVCGHSGCGAMQAVLREGVPGDDGALGRWLGGAAESLSRFRGGHPVGERADAAGASEVDRLAMVNVAVQLDRLARHRGWPPPSGKIGCGWSGCSSTRDRPDVRPRRRPVRPGVDGSAGSGFGVGPGGEAADRSLGCRL